MTDDPVNHDPSTDTFNREHVTLSDCAIGLRFDAVRIRNLRVLITEESPNVWVAEGLEIDYAAQGRSVAEVKQRFQDGLRATINEHLRQYRSIENLLVRARDDVFMEFQDAIEGPVLYSQVSIHVEPIEDELPITYLRKAA
ncbi:MAG TPA: hypothetical protein VGQ36_26095 [Thermoanaerobaculia bacterium]|jgi:hypothetical protein|nr:hypothetical protein [Thermoanaerobaculia bacterium]